MKPVVPHVKSDPKLAFKPHVPPSVKPAFRNIGQSSVKAAVKLAWKPPGPSITIKSSLSEPVGVRLVTQIVDIIMLLLCYYN